jgi:lysophospholipase L1-like esterase
MKLHLDCTLFALALAGSTCAFAQPTLERVDPAPPTLAPATTSTISRVARSGDGTAATWTYQWPGTYFETAFTGSEAYFKLGPGDVALHVAVDGQPLPPLLKPAPGTYRIAGLAQGKHAVRIDTVSENQSASERFDGFFLAPGATPASVQRRARRIEFIGDSHTVGYGNMSASHDCTAEQLFAATDTSQAFGPITARHYDADYRVTAISGRGIVRNYDGGAGDVLPAAYPWVLFDKSVRDTDTVWQPDVLVIALGTNDFSTPVKPGERWPDRAALAADYEANYVGFVKSLRRRYPGAYVVLWSTDAPGGEVRPEAEKVLRQLNAAGESRIRYVPVAGLDLAGCHFHPSAADHGRIAAALQRAIDDAEGWDKG